MVQSMPGAWAQPPEGTALSIYPPDYFKVGNSVIGNCWLKEHPSSLPKALLIIDSTEICGGVYINKDLSYLQPRMT